MGLDIHERMLQSRIDLLVDHPFYGSIALHLPLKVIPEAWAKEMKSLGKMPTFYTDYRYIYYNPEFAESCSRKDKKFILAHEILHNVFLHGIRRGEREPERWNFATDFAINAVLRKEFHYVPEGGLYDV